MRTPLDKKSFVFASNKAQGDISIIPKSFCIFIQIVE